MGRNGANDTLNFLATDALPPPGSTSPLSTRGRAKIAQSNEQAITTLNAKLMEKTFGELVRNYVKHVYASIPESDQSLKARVSFLTNNQEVALVGLAGHDTWATPIKDLDQDQVNAGLRALSWITTEMVHKLSTIQRSGSSAMQTVLPQDQVGYSNFIHAVNSLTLLRAALIVRDRELNPTITRSEFPGRANGRTASSPTNFSDVFLYWDPSYHCYHYSPCYYDYHHGHYYHHNSWNWNSHGYYGHCHGDPFPVAHALGEHVIVPAVDHTIELYSKLFDLQIRLAGDLIELGGRTVHAIAEGAGDVLHETAHLLGDASHHVGGAINNGLHATQGCCDQIGHGVGSGCHEVGSCIGHVGHDLGHCIEHLGVDCFHLMANAGGGLLDVMGQAAQTGAECVSVCGQCGNRGCDCQGCDGSAGEAIMGCLAGVGACCVGIGTWVKAECCPTDPSAGASSSPPSYAEATGQDVVSDILNHPNYSDATAIATGANWVICGLPLLYKTGKDAKMLCDSERSDRDRAAAKQDLCTSILCVAGVEGLGFVIAPELMGIKVTTNLAISAGVCGREVSYFARVRGETKDNFGVTHADKYFLTAAQINVLVNNQQIVGRQAGRDDPVSKLDFIARENTQYWKEAVSGKNLQNALARKTRHFVSCGGYGCANNNVNESARNEAMVKISEMKQGFMPTRTQPPAYEQQPFSRNSRFMY